jgi:16S rRNA G1207 methylase RsmC
LLDAGYIVEAGTDFLEYRQPHATVIMNPPFEAGQDIDHIVHAFNYCLEPGGELVSVCSSGPFFRSDRKSEAFRDLIKAYGYSQELPEGSFMESGTMVNTRLVYLRKPLD